MSLFLALGYEYLDLSYCAVTPLSLLDLRSAANTYPFPLVIVPSHKCILTKGASYRFRLAATTADDNFKAFAEIDITVNSPPRKGDVKVNV